MELWGSLREGRALAVSGLAEGGGRQGWCARRGLRWIGARGTPYRVPPEELALCPQKLGMIP